MNIKRFRTRWTKFWMTRAGRGPFRRVVTHLATWFVPPYYGRIPLARMNPRGYISPQATIYHANLRLGKHCYVDDGVLIYQDVGEGAVILEDGVHLHRNTIIQTGKGGQVIMGANTHIQPHCQFSAYMGTITIGQRVEIAPNCAFYPYDHGVLPDVPVAKQPLKTQGGIVVEDDVWLGFGVTVLDGVRIGKGAVIGAGAVVSHDIPEDSIAVGIPARVVKWRNEKQNE